MACLNYLVFVFGAADLFLNMSGELWLSTIFKKRGLS